MKKLFIVAALAAISACNNEPKVESVKSPDGDSTKQQQDVTYPYTVTYSSKFEIGDANQAKMILDIWKDYDNGNLAGHKDNFADTVELYFSDGTMFKGSRDSAVATGQNVRNMFSAVTSRVDAVVPLKSTDKNQNWVCIWGGETTTDKKGKVDSSNLQETWRFNKAGKTDLVYQFRQSYPKPKK